MSKVLKEGVSITLPVVNDADFGFKPDIPNDRIIFGLKGINGINTEVSQAIIANRPYYSIEDFAEKMLDKTISEDEETLSSKIKPSQMINLIKGGCFTELHSPDRRITMDWYLRNYKFKPIESLTLTQLPKLKEFGLIPETLDLACRMVNFKKYVLDNEGLIEKYIDPNKKMVKRGYHDGHYILDDNSQPFFVEHFTEDSVIRVQNGFYVISEKKFIKEVDKYIQPLKDWFASPETLDKYNECLYQQVWDNFANGSTPHWNMQALTYYDGEHELEHINEDLYGIVNFEELPEEPEPYQWYTRYVNGIPKQCAKYKISCIAGTVVNNDNNHHTITLITKYGPVNVKFNKGHYAFYNKRISEVGDDGKKHVIEDSWFKRGTLLRCAGIRRDDQFYPTKYNDTIYSHTVNRIIEVHDDGTLLLQSERTYINKNDN